MGDVVMITAASGGLGRATARRFAQDGAKIALLARGETGLEAAAREIEQQGGRAFVLPTDVSDTERSRSIAASSARLPQASARPREQCSSASAI